MLDKLEKFANKLDMKAEEMKSSSLAYQAMKHSTRKTTGVRELMKVITNMNATFFLALAGFIIFNAYIAAIIFSVMGAGLNLLLSIRNKQKIIEEEKK